MIPRMDQATGISTRKRFVILPAGARHLVLWLPVTIVFLVSFSLYVATLAPGPIPGDPSEYIFVPHILGIAHPPGYALYTLIAKLWQTIVRVGTIAYRTNLLAAFAGAVIAALVYGTVWQMAVYDPSTKTPDHNRESLAPFASPAPVLLQRVRAIVPSLVAALSVMAGVDVWQHAIQSNAHIVTAMLAMLCLFLLVCWWKSGNDRWLYTAALAAGLSLTHHPILAFSFPAYGVFSLWVKPRLITQPRKLLTLAVCFGLGLSVMLYYPLRGPSAPFNPLPTLDSVLIHVTARGLTVNLFPFGLRDQPTRLIVFWELLRLQYPLVTLLLAALGVGWLAKQQQKLLALFAVFLLFNLAFTLNTIQDVLAYLMSSFVVVAVLAGVGLSALLQFATALIQKTNHSPQKSAGAGVTKTPSFNQWIVVAAAASFLVAPISTAVHNCSRVSLSDYRAGDDWVDAVFEQFVGKRQHAVLLAPWEALTPLWVAQYTQGRRLDPDDVKLVYIAATSTNPWLEGVFAHWNEGPVYLADFRRGVWEGGGFRLRPEGRWPLWRVVGPGDVTTSQTPSILLNASAEGKVELLSYSLEPTHLRPGEAAHLTLSMRAPITLTYYVMPFALVGDRVYRWTTDSRAIPPWRPGEIIVERYEVMIPFGTPPGQYPVRLGVTDSMQGRDLIFSSGDTAVSIGTLTIEPATGIAPPQAVLDSALANWRSEIALMGVTARVGNQIAHNVWTQPLAARPGQDIELWLNWRALKQPSASYKVFVHLIQNDQLAAPAADYYTPLGGAFPTHLWIPVWVEGQSVFDPNRLTIPPTLPPGNYAVEIGLYELESTRRAPLFDRAGNLAGDRVILGPVTVR